MSKGTISKLKVSKETLDQIPLFLYLLACCGFIGYLFEMSGRYEAYVNYIDEVLLFSGVVTITYLFLKRKLVITHLSLIILCYIVLRVGIVSFFALSNEYSVLNYIFPLKNWLVLLIFFAIGQSTDVDDKDIQSVVLKTLSVTVIALLLTEVLVAIAQINMADHYPLPSRYPFIPLRMGIDDFVVVLSFFIATERFLKHQITSFQYLLFLTIIVISFFIAQTKQVLFAMGIVSVFLIYEVAGRKMTRRQIRYFIFLPILTVLILFGIYISIVSTPEDVYASYFRRSLAIDFAIQKVGENPVAGYPIPSNAFGGPIPGDIERHFFGEDLENIIYPSDVPLLFIVAEEGTLGIIFLVVFLFLSLRRNPRGVGVIIIILLSLLGTFRMYYLIPVGSSLSYFLLGAYTRRRIP